MVIIVAALFLQAKCLAHNPQHQSTDGVLNTTNNVPEITKWLTEHYSTLHRIFFYTNHINFERTGHYKFTIRSSAQSRF